MRAWSSGRHHPPPRRRLPVTNLFRPPGSGHPAPPDRWARQEAPLPNGTGSQWERWGSARLGRGGRQPASQASTAQSRASRASRAQGSAPGGREAGVGRVAAIMPRHAMPAHGGRPSLLSTHTLSLHSRAGPRRSRASSCLPSCLPNPPGRPAAGRSAAPPLHSTLSYPPTLSHCSGGASEGGARRGGKGGREGRRQPAPLAPAPPLPRFAAVTSRRGREGGRSSPMNHQRLIRFIIHRCCGRGAKQRHRPASPPARIRLPTRIPLAGNRGACA
eukprot:scaffold567_cov384-Prasinococcus_capsulatus_cf.AAC.18